MTFPWQSGFESHVFQNLLFSYKRISSYFCLYITVITVSVIQTFFAADLNLK